ncbi:hypothetical protein Pyrfu_1234 [Pyrolobus fumarii 1A]|uniref:Uncharacterized protein n=1 Tax=Pyrolobus fumarii (strain DSM 11204 / 1A) TaxID=694429 RepID=G0EFZ2_PYRF1|nr:hypothetical protein Pyrfu_1234 [Pyrolobus fumarii 1A]
MCEGPRCGSGEVAGGRFGVEPPDGEPGGEVERLMR